MQGNRFDPAIGRYVIPKKSLYFNSKRGMPKLCQDRSLITGSPQVMPYFSIDAHPLHYELHGNGEPVILIPGLGGAAGSWRQQIGPFAERFRCMTYDHIGTGRSARRQMTYTVDGMADDLLALMDAVGIASAHLVGHSTGGAIAQTIACRHPDRVRRLVLHATWANADAYFRTIFAMRRDMLCAIGVEAYLRSTAFFLYPPWWINTHQTEIENSIAVALAERPNPAILASRIDAVLAFDRSADLPLITAPTLVTVAANDILCAPHFARQVANLIPAAMLTVFPDGGHAIHQILPAEFNRHVIPFLTAA
jgi:aminoacrylate hydrolase